MYCSYNELLSLGWKSSRKNIEIPRTFPDSDFIILEKDDKFLVHNYVVYTDYSDYPGHESKVNWRNAELRSVVKYVIDYK